MIDIFIRQPLLKHFANLSHLMKAQMIFTYSKNNSIENYILFTYFLYTGCLFDHTEVLFFKFKKR